MPKGKGAYGRSGTYTNVIGELAIANQEQSHNIDQTTDAVLQIESVTQENAASSEEGASASQELSDQAQELLAT